MSKLKWIVPAGFLLLVLMFGLAIKFGAGGTKVLESTLINSNWPEFSLQNLFDENDQITKEDIIGEAMLVNVWGSWCITCKAEHPVLNQLKEDGVKIVGLNYKDNKQDALDWLLRLGDPYAVSIFDNDGILGLDLGVTGAPETFFVDAKGQIVEKLVGELTLKNWQETYEAVYEASK